MELEFRWTDGSDADFKRFYRETEEYYSRVAGGADRRKGYIPHNLSETVPDVLIAYDSGTPVGCAGLRAYSDKEVEIKRLWVEPGYRGRHIAREIMDRIEGKAREQHFERAILQTRLQMTEAVGLYVQRGYVRTENYPPYDSLEGAICFAKDLGGPAGRRCGKDSMEEEGEKAE